MKLAQWNYGAVVFGILLVIAGVWYMRDIRNGDACSGTENSALCYISEAEAKARDNGIGEALQYVTKVVVPNTNYKVVHLAMHSIGNEAYARTEDVGQALAYLPWYGEVERFLDFNGYQHGVLEMYFLAEGDGTPQTLITEACAPFVNLASFESASREEKIRGPECFHAAGHALMYALKNEVPDALSACDVSPYDWMREWCYHGVFMENYYLYLPSYESHAPRPYAQGNTGIDMCRTIDARYRTSCSQFVGWIYAEVHPGDFVGAFDACAAFGKDDKRICIARTGRFHIAARFRENFPAMVDTCMQADSDASACLQGTAIGVSEGIAGDEQRNKVFCDAVPENERSACVDAVARSRESLARIYVTEL